MLSVLAKLLADEAMNMTAYLVTVLACAKWRVAIVPYNL